MIKSIAHASFLVADVARSLEFYCGVLDIHLNEHRPNFPFDGAWLDLNAEGQQLHLIPIQRTVVLSMVVKINILHWSLMI